MNKHLHCPDESHVCQHGEDESCPAMNTPESETPETDAWLNKHGGEDGALERCSKLELLNFARSLERRLSLMTQVRDGWYKRAETAEHALRLCREYSANEKIDRRYLGELIEAATNAALKE